ncbi:MAG: molybdate ABC transporter substrate-binding protein [Flavobacteriales bacterium]|nr:molybdate ABC transporter substrate-binding protein [Flavobacteriales bacterium]
MIRTKNAYKSIQLVGAILVLFLQGCAINDKDTIMIATSANMEPPLRELVKLYAEESNAKIEVIIASSGQLSSQITQGAPFDLFISANRDYPETLHLKGICESPITYAYGSLAIWSVNLKSLSEQSLIEDRIKKIAIPNPELAPYGEAAVAYLKAINIYDKIEHKLVFAESVSQVNTFIKSEAVDIGITSYSTIKDEQNEGLGTWMKLNQNYYSPIQQDLCILRNSRQSEKVEQFVNFVLSDKGKVILEKYGYIVPSDNLSK